MTLEEAREERLNTIKLNKPIALSAQFGYGCFLWVIIGLLNF